MVSDLHRNSTVSSGMTNHKHSPHIISPGGLDFAYERGGDAHRKFWIKPLKKTDLGMAQAFFDL